MRNVELMVELLEEMSNDAGGEILLVRTLGMSSDTRNKYHHAELLSDAGLATWKSDSMIRVTNHGYDFLSAVNQDRPTHIEKCRELLGQGKSLLEVAATIITIVSGGG